MIDPNKGSDPYYIEIKKCYTAKNLLYNTARGPRFFFLLSLDFPLFCERSVKRILVSKSKCKLITLLRLTLICSVLPCCLTDDPNFKMNRHALLEIMAKARIQLNSQCYAGSARFGWSLLFYIQLDNITEIQTPCATKPRLRAGAASLYVLHSP